MNKQDESPELFYLRFAAELFDTQGEFAAACSDEDRTVKQGHVATWLTRSKKAPADMVLRIERATDGKVTRHQLRPDVFGRTPDEFKPAA